jgi:signal transduction histidine kinase
VSRRRSIDPQRALQVGFLVLLLVCVAQVVWWIIDQVAFTRAMQGRLLEHYEADAAAAELLVAEGCAVGEVQALFPYLVASPDGDGFDIRRAVIEEMDEERRRRIRRYGWEGSFFLLVLVAGLAVLAQALRQDVLLRRRQQNFVAAVSHELKSPLASLRLSLETLSMRDPPAERRRQLVERTLEDLQRLEVMVANMLDTARIEEGRLHLEPARVRVAEVAGGVLDEVRGRAAEAGVALELDVAPGLEVLADPVALRAVLRNLADNALKATEASGGGTVRVAGAREDGIVRVEVVDDGVGFDPGEARRLFEKFYRPGDELRRRSRGSGLGLYLVRSYVELDGGSVAAESEGPGRGARFIVRWPAPGDDRPGAP